ncbi:MAG: hypothetical protein ACK5OB_20300 [Pirellula sp.]
MKHAVWLLKSASRWGIHRIETGVERLLDDQAVRRYWICHRRRAEAWQAEWSKTVPSMAIDALDQNDMASRRRARLIHSVLVSEPLTRIVSASVAASAMDSPCGGQESLAMLKSITRMQLEARNHCLQGLIEGLEQHAMWAVAAERLRRDTERWTDLLLGLFVDREQALAFAFQPDRAAEVESLYGHRQLGGVSIELQSLFLAGQRDWMQQHARVDVFQPSLDRAIVDAAMDMLTPSQADNSLPTINPVAHRVLRRLNELDALFESVQ